MRLRQILHEISTARPVQKKTACEAVQGIGAWLELVIVLFSSCPENKGIIPAATLIDGWRRYRAGARGVSRQSPAQ